MPSGWPGAARRSVTRCGRQEGSKDVAAGRCQSAVLPAKVSLEDRSERTPPCLPQDIWYFCVYALRSTWTLRPYLGQEEMPRSISGIFAWQGDGWWQVGSISVILSLNLVDRNRFLSLPDQIIHNLFPVPTCMLCSSEGKSHLLLKTFLLLSVFH